MIQRLFTSIDAKEQAPWLSTNLRLEVLNEDGIPLLKFDREHNQHIEAFTRGTEDLIQQYRAFSLFRASAGRNPESSIAQAEKGLKTFQKLHELLADGYSVRKAALRLNITIGVAHKLAQGESPAAITHIRLALSESSQQSFTVAPTSAQDFSRILGVYLATSKGAVPNFITFSKQDEAPIRKVEAALQALLPEGGWKISEKPIGSVQYYSARIFHAEFRHTLTALTHAGQEVPLQILSTENAQKEFLRGFLAFSASTTKDGIRIKSVKSPLFITQLGVLFQEFGVTPALMTGSTRYLAFNDKNELNKLLELDLIESPELRARVEERIQYKEVSSRRSYDATSYYQVLSTQKQFPDRSLRDIAQQLALPPKVVTSWVRGVNIPQSVLREQKLEELRVRFNIQRPSQVHRERRDEPSDIAEQIAIAKEENITAWKEHLPSENSQHSMRFSELRAAVLKHHSFKELTTENHLVSAHHYRKLLTVAHELGYTPTSLDECAWNIALHYSSAITRRTEQTLRKHTCLSRVISMEEGSSIGLEAAFKAIKRFDPERGIPLESFIKHRVVGAIHDEARLRQDETRAVHSTAKAIHTDGIVPTVASVTETLGVSRDIAIRALDHIDKIETGGMNRAHKDVTTIDLSQHSTPSLPESFTGLRRILPQEDLYLLISHFIHKASIRELSEVSGKDKKEIRRLIQKHKETLHEVFYAETDSE